MGAALRAGETTRSVPTESTAVTRRIWFSTTSPSPTAQPEDEATSIRVVVELDPLTVVSEGGVFACQPPAIRRLCQSGAVPVAPPPVAKKSIVPLAVLCWAICPRRPAVPWASVRMPIGLFASTFSEITRIASAASG